jgi:hypothetical protein
LLDGEVIVSTVINIAWVILSAKELPVLVNETDIRVVTACIAESFCTIQSGAMRIFISELVGLLEPKLSSRKAKMVLRPLTIPITVAIS